MELINEYLNSFGPQNVFWGYCFVLGLTVLGLIPSNSDLVIIVGGLLISQNVLNPIETFTSILLVVIILETIVFIVGSVLGKKVLSNKLLLKVLSAKTQDKLKKLIQTNPKRLLFILRVTPFLRPVFYLALGALELPKKEFFKVHALLFSLYATIVVGVSTTFSHFVSNMNSMQKNLLIGAFIFSWFMLVRAFKKNFQKELS